MAVNIDWGLLRPANIYGAFESGLQDARRAKKDAREAARQDVQDAYYQSRIDAEAFDQRRQTAEDERLAAGRKTAGDLLAKGDYAGAQTAALGDKELYDHIKGLDAAHREQLKGWNATIGQSMRGLLGPDGKPLPDAAVRWQNMRAQLVGSGIPEDMVNVDVTKPGAIEAELADAGQMDELLKSVETYRHNTAMESIPKVVGNGAVAIGPDGEVMYRNPRTFAPPRPPAARAGAAPDPALVAIEAVLRQRGLLK